MRTHPHAPRSRMTERNQAAGKQSYGAPRLPRETNAGARTPTKTHEETLGLRQPPRETRRARTPHGAARGRTTQRKDLLTHNARHRPTEPPTEARTPRDARRHRRRHTLTHTDTEASTEKHESTRRPRETETVTACIQGGRAENKEEDGHARSTTETHEATV